MSKLIKISIIICLILITLIPLSPQGDCYDLTGTFGGASGTGVSETSITLNIPSPVRTVSTIVYYEFSAVPPGMFPWGHSPINPRFDVYVNSNKIYSDSVAKTYNNLKTGSFVVPANTAASFTAYSGLDGVSYYYYVYYQYSVTYKFTYVVDSELPSVSITNPVNTDVKGIISIEAAAGDNYGVAAVEFYIDNEKKATYTSAPYSYSWNTGNYSNGGHTVMVKAIDACGNVQSTSKTVTIDNQIPAVNISNPVDADVKGTMNISAAATDNIGIGSVDFYVDNVKKTTVTSPPYSYAWNTGVYSNGVHTIMVTAYDKAGNSQSISKNFTVDNEFPAVSITSPVDTTVSGNVTITANASDNNRITQVEFYIDSLKQSTVTGAPYSYTWNTRTCPNGSHTITVKAYDPVGNVQSANKTVTTSNSDTTPPVVTITSPLNNGTVSGLVTVNANVTDSQGYIAKVEFYIDGIKKSTLTTAPYTYSFNATGSKHTIKVIAYDGAGFTGEATVNISVQTHIDINSVNLLPPIN